jgi:hypothetical protein
MKKVYHVMLISLAILIRDVNNYALRGVILATVLDCPHDSDTGD